MQHEAFVENLPLGAAQGLALAFHDIADAQGSKYRANGLGRVRRRRNSLLHPQDTRGTFGHCAEVQLVADIAPGERFYYSRGSQ